MTLHPGGGEAMNPTSGTPVQWLPPPVAFVLVELKIEVGTPSPEAAICHTATTPTRWARSLP